MLAQSAVRLRAAPARLGRLAPSRSFLTGHTMSKYWMKRAKILHIIGRMVVAYPQMHYIPEPDAPINKLFARGAGERERAFMFVLSQMPPDEPIDIAEFVRGASDAARTVCAAVQEEGMDELLETMALPDVVATWKQKSKQLRTLLGASDAASVQLESVEVIHAGLAEVNYTYSDARPDEDEEEEDDKKENPNKEASEKTAPKNEVSEESDRQPSIFMMHEAIQVKVQFEIRESVRVLEPESTQDRTVLVDSTFDWTFESDVSRDEFVDWVITSASPFSSRIAPNDDTVDDIQKDIEQTL